MKSGFDYWKKLHDSENLVEFNYNLEGQLWLKVKSIVRKELITEFSEKYSFNFSSNKLSEQFKELFNFLQKDIKNSHNLLDSFIKEKNNLLLTKLDTKKLVSELYKLKVFEWGGDYQNSLDKYLVSHYVKTISSYDELMSKFKTEINRAVQGYVLNSWYNHWSSILIEHIFKSHKIVLPTVGQIKSVDFFINNIPFDLKVTYFPSEYLKEKRREKGYPVELTFLKSKAKELSIDFDKKGSNSDIHYEIIEKMRDRNDKASQEVIKTLKEQNISIVQESQENPKLLAKWLYENQGEMRFGAENRLFLVLVDTDDFSNSWKLKRNLDILKPTINKFLDSFIRKHLDDLKIEFKYLDKPNTFCALADVVYLIK